MIGIILAAGLGKRLKTHTRRIPKPMLKVGGRPIIEYTLRLFRKFGIKDIVINLHYKPQAITGYLGCGEKFGVKIRYSFEPVLLGTAGAVKNLEPLLKKTFLVAYGDTLRNIDIGGMLKAHKKNRADLTIALYRAGDSKGCGIAKMRPDNAIYRFIEKPRRMADIEHEYANCGVYAIEPGVLSLIPAGKRYDFSSELFPLLLKKGYRIYGYPTQSYLLDIGTAESYARAKKVSGMFKDI